MPKGLLEQGQITMQGKSLKPTEGGMNLYKTLLAACPNVVDPARTAAWEMIFDLVEKGRMNAEDAVSRINAETLREIENIVQAAGSVQISIGKSGKPTPRMLAAAKSIAERKGIKLPAKAKTDSAACRKFLDEHLPKRDPNAPAGQGGTYPPSAKQLEFAQRLAKEGGLQIPPEAMGSAKEMSAWIDKAMKKQPPRKPSEKQLAFARKLAEENDVDLPADAEADMKKCSAFIDKMMGGGKQKAARRTTKA